MHRAIRHGAAFLLLFVTAATTTSVLSPETRAVSTAAPLTQEENRSRTILIGEWSGFCCGLATKEFAANSCSPCLSGSKNALLARDALPKGSSKIFGIVFNSAMSAFSTAAWPTPPVQRLTEPHEFASLHRLSPLDCSHRFPKLKARCVAVPHNLTLLSWYEMDAIAHRGPYISETKILPPRLPWQLRAVINMESLQYWPHMAHPDVRGAYDIHVGIHRKLTDTQVMFEQIGKPEDYNTTIPSRAQYGDNIVVAFISNCESMNDREAYLEELMKFIDVHSYGACLRTKDLNESKTSVWHDLEHKREIQGRYMFTLAFENANEDDWVTEKLFDPLRAGSIPVYIGANNVDNYLPCVNASCIIEVRKFVDPKDLASHLLHVSQSENMFNALHAWRAHPMREDFIQLTKLTRQNYQCATCERAAALFQL